MSYAPAPLNSPTNLAPAEPCLESFHLGARGTEPLITVDPIMAAMGLFFAKKEAATRARLASLRERLRCR